MTRYFPVLLFFFWSGVNAAQAQAPAASVAQDWLRLNATKIDWSDHAVADKHRAGLNRHRTLSAHPRESGDPERNLDADSQALDSRLRGNERTITN